MSRFAGWLRAEGLLWVAVVLGVLFSGLAGSVVGFNMSVRRSAEAQRERDEARAKVADAESRAVAAEVKVAPWVAEAKAAKAKADDAMKDAIVRASLGDAEVASKLAGARAKIEADAATARNIIARDAEKMGEVYPDLKPYERGVNTVHHRYIENFELSGDKILFRMKNWSGKPINPRFTLALLNKDGFVTDQAAVVWLLETIEPNQSRNDEKE